MKTVTHKQCKKNHSRVLTIASIALLLAPFPKTVLAEEISETASLPTLTVEGNALYDAVPSEELTGYNIEAVSIGTKTPSSLKDIPQSITVLTNDYIEDRGFVHLDDAAKVTPGLRTLTNDSGRSSIYSRGYEYDDALIDGLSAPISSKYGSLPSLSAFDRIEIMRGPSGLFSSTSELGGIINLVRKRATEDTQASIDVGAGSWGRYNLGTDISGSLNDDGSVRGRLVLSQTDTSSQVDENDNVDQSIYATVEIDLDEQTELSIGVLHQNKDIVPNNGLPTYADGTLLDVDRSTFIGADWNEFTAESTDIFMDITRQFDNGGRGRIAARASERNVDYEYAYILSSVDDDGDFTTLYASKEDRKESAFAFDASYSQPFEVMGHVSEFVVGVDAKQESTDGSSDDQSLTGSYNISTFDSSAITRDLFTFSLSDSEASESEQAVYGKLTFRPMANLALITGARISNYELDSGSQEESGTAFTPYAGAVLDVTDNQALYASYSEVFKPQTSTDENGDFIDPRVGKQFEAGLKGSYANGLLNSRLSVFQLTDTNRSEQVTGESYYEASGKIRIRGFEAELSGQFGAWDVLAGYTYMDTETLSGSDLRTESLMPKHTLSSWAKYRLSASGLLENVDIGAGFSFLSSFSATGRDSVEVVAPSYTLVDTAINKQINDNLKVSFKINNLLDETYYERVGGTTIFNFYGAGRNFMASANYAF
ncbi:TonB-dependent siderophore receptor [Marinomonas sp. C2222]|uniref:TonB-dependent siderophore receptor n=1 Tax=Marinomonas sargassi TaxID=2984494 RepID=A0ABT2YNL2_9GAMM|nr:TonB-dependent siderophore receptor [Marinomonas sargassi]MCV2401479.1 TonB-dependent siderophore receptor [Marinomonas sargassi]